MKLYLTTSKELAERSVREGFEVYWRQFEKDMNESEEGSFDGTHVFYDRIWPPQDDEACLEFNVEMTPEQVERYDCRAANTICRAFSIPFELLEHAPLRLLTEAEIIAQLVEVLDWPASENGPTCRESLLKDLAAGDAISRYEREALRQSDSWT